jgi:peptidoglycan/LPS O-acetylase OafA/YrhL
MFLLYVGVFDGGYRRLWLLVGSEYKYGYWFTIVLFEMNLIHYLLQLVVRHKVGLFCALAGVAALLIMAKDWDWYHNDAFLSQWLCLRLLAQYFPYYVVGVMCMAYSGMFHKLLANEYIVGGLIALFAALYVYPGSGFYKALLLGLVGTFTMYQLCRHYQDVLSQSTVVGRQLQMIGRSTLSIYLIHYFFIQGIKMPWIQEHLNITGQGWIIAAITAVVAILVVYASMAVAAMLKVSTPLYRIMLGK